MAFIYFEIPLSSTAQQFNIALGGRQYLMLLQWRDTDMGGWFLDISTSAGVAILLGVPLVTGADLLAQYPDKGFGGVLRVTTDGDPDAVPTYSNIGTQSHVYFGVES